MWALSIGIPALYAAVLALSWTRVGSSDYPQFLVFHELQYWNSSLFGMAKQWTPVIAGGVSMAGHPQIPVFSLSMALAYGLGPLVGMKAALAIYLLMGWVGMYRFAALWLDGKPVRALAASLFIGNGFFLARFSHGHVDLIPFLVLPLVLWLMHRAVEWDREALGLAGVPRLLLAVLLLGAGLGLVVDGAPVAFVHLLVWVGLYALVLAVATRTMAPLVLLGGAMALTAVLDAGYLWPMLVAQADFPRFTHDAFTNPVALVWFMLLPVRGKIIPAPANGHELSVFVGPVVTWAVWRYRKCLWRSLPSDAKTPLLVVSAASIWLGMGSLRPLHVPLCLSLFDLLRFLPGFRSVGVTGRYWGFLALPLSLLGALALTRLATEKPPPRYQRLWLAIALVLQFAFQTESLAGGLLASDLYRPVQVRGAFQGRTDRIEFLRLGEDDQYASITPVTGVINFYDMDDFVRPAMRPGRRLIRAVLLWRAATDASLPVKGEFAAWSRIRLSLSTGAHAPPPENQRSIVRIVLHQAYHPLWSVVGAGASLRRDAKGNLTVLCSLERLARGPVDLAFRDPVSDEGMRVSLAAIRVVPAAAAALAAGALAVKRWQERGCWRST